MCRSEPADAFLVLLSTSCHASLRLGEIWSIGKMKSPVCGDSPIATESQKDSTTRWKQSHDKRMDLETLKTTN